MRTAAPTMRATSDIFFSASKSLPLPSTSSLDPSGVLPDPSRPFADPSDTRTDPLNERAEMPVDASTMRTTSDNFFLEAKRLLTPSTPPLDNSGQLPDPNCAFADP